MTTPDPALVQAARDLGLELAAYGCNAFHGAGQSCLNTTEEGVYCKWCRRIAAFGAAQRAEGYEQGRRDEYNEATRQAVDR